MFVEGNFSKEQYNLIKRYVGRVVPNYNVVLTQKKLVNPAGIRVDDQSAEVGLQSLLDRTTERVVEANSLATNSIGLTMLWKWGMDGSSGQGQYNQEGPSPGSDSGVIIICVVPIRLTADNGDVIRQNPKCSSSYLCRPVKFFFAKEDSDLILEEEAQMTSQINALTNTVVVICGPVLVNHSLVLTMIDGKVCNSLSHTDSAMRCYNCKVTISHFNKPAVVFPPACL